MEAQPMVNEKTVGYVLLCIGGAFVVFITVIGTAVSPLKSPGTWIAALLTLSIFSFLYNDNPVYKFSEHLFIGISAAYWMVIGIWQTLIPNLVGRLAPGFVSKHFHINADVEPNYFYTIPLFLGILLLCKLIPSIHWISRWPLAFIIGATAGLNLIRYLLSDFIAQVRNSMIPLVAVENGTVQWGQSFSNTIMITGILASLSYFFFSKEHKGWFGHASRYGVFILMIAFGAAFGYTVMGRIALLIGRIEFLLHTWLQII
jgi:hypothetical protein